MNLGDCPECGKTIFERKYLIKWHFKITEICSNCGTPLIRDKIYRIVHHGWRITLFQYVAVILLFGLVVTITVFNF